MRVTYRGHGGSDAYWGKRWAQIPADDGQLNLQRYPGKFAERVMQEVSGEVLEAGCGAGRVLLHYHRLRRPITGIDFIGTAIEKIQRLDPSVNARQADITQLPFEDQQFQGVLAFGLYHSLESGIEKAFQETRRVMQPDGILCASVRMDNIQNRLNDWLADKNAPPGTEKFFHKANFTPREFRALLRNAGFETTKVEFVENMPLLYKFKIFRHRAHKVFDEHRARGEGYQLSWFGNLLQKSLISVFPQSFCNIMVATARAI